MASIATPLARLVASLVLLAATVVLLAGCGSRSRELQPGAYRAVLETPGGDLPFGLDVASEEAGFVLYLVNGEERVRISEVTVADGVLSAIMPGFENTLSARISGKRLKGEVSLLRAGGERQVLRFEAELGQAWRFFEAPLTDNADVAGRWSVTFTDDAGATSPGVAELAQSFSYVTGTILTPTGDHRYLAGEVRGDELHLSRFDGALAYLYRARLNDRGELEGEYWSGRTSHRRFVAVRNADAVLDTSTVATGMREPGARLEFAFRDLDGRLVSLSDPRYQGKVVIVTLAGSWCPNCHDEAAFLAPLYLKYRDQGLEVVALMFEYFGDFEQAVAATRRFRDKLGIEYTTLIAGTSDKDEASRALPQLTGVRAYPTTIFVDRSGRVRRIHAGFAGPATGLHHDALTGEFIALVETLLAEPESDPAALGDGSATAAAPEATP
jgi:thiol-disulfide isomerase/thioredoxin